MKNYFIWSLQQSYPSLLKKWNHQVRDSLMCILVVVLLSLSTSDWLWTEFIWILSCQQAISTGNAGNISYENIKEIFSSAGNNNLEYCL